MRTAINGSKTHMCENCGNDKWMGSKIPIEVHHIDGNNKNNLLENIQFLCPNCHALTPNYRGRNKKKVIKEMVSDERFIEALRDSYRIRHALIKLELKGCGDNYRRANELILKHNITLKKSIMSDMALERLKTIEEKYGSVKNMLKHKIKWPLKDFFEREIPIRSICSIAKELGVSDNSVRKKIKSYGLDVKKLSPWSQKHGDN